MRNLLLAIPFLVPDMTARVAVEAAVTINTAQPAVVVSQCKCGGTCVNGIITQGDGHRTPCPCPSTCACKSKPKTQCANGSCAVRK